MNLSLGQQRSLLDWLRLIYHHGRNRAKSSRGGLVKAVRTALFSAAVRSPPDRVRLYISIFRRMDADESAYSLPELLRRYIQIWNGARSGGRREVRSYLQPHFPSQVAWTKLIR